MESMSHLGLRANSAASVSACTSCASSVRAMRTSSKSCKSFCRTMFRISASADFPSRDFFPAAVTASTERISPANVKKLSTSKVNAVSVAEEDAVDGRLAEPVEEKPASEEILMAIATLALAAEKQRRDEKPSGKVQVPGDAFRQGRLVERERVYRQTFVIRSYEVGATKTASIETTMNHFQEAALNHVWVSGLAGDGFGATHAMMKTDLIWVVTRMQVEVERYPVWGQVVEVDTWVMSSGKNGVRRDWLLRDYKSGQILARATSTWVMMNRCTRRLSKLSDEVRTEIAPYFLERSALLEKNVPKINKLRDDAEYTCGDLKPKRSDLDMNEHVNNVKYIGWILESVPDSIANNHELTSITLEYRRECGQWDVVQSMTTMEATPHPFNELSSDTRYSYSLGALAVTPENIYPRQFVHLLRLQADGAELVRGRTSWRSKQ